MSITPEVKARLEAAGHQAALSFVDELAKQKTFLGPVELLEMHRLIFIYSWPEIAGRFRNQDVEIVGTSFLPSHWTHIPALISQMLKALYFRLDRLEQGDIQDIVELAAQAHYDLAVIHPFRDGNGRVARLILNYVFRYFDLPYVIIPREQRERYLDALEEANRGNIIPFIELVAEQYEHSLDRALNEIDKRASAADEQS